MTIADPTASNNPQGFQILLEVGDPGPRIATNTDTNLYFNWSRGSYPVPQTIQVSIVSGGTLNWAATSNVNWLQFSPASGSTKANSWFMLSCKNLETLARGSYQATVTISDPASSNGSITFNVTLSVYYRQAELALNPSQFYPTTSRGFSPPPQTLLISNLGTDTEQFTWTATTPQTWATLTPSSGTLPAGSSAQVSIAINAAALPVGISTATITVATSGMVLSSPQTAYVYVNVLEPPIVACNATSLSFSAVQAGPLPPIQYLGVSNGQSSPYGVDSLFWGAVANVPWLSLSPPKKNNSTLVTVGPDNADQGPLLGTLTRRAVNGVATFDGIACAGGSGVSIRAAAADPVIGSAVSDYINIRYTFAPSYYYPKSNATGVPLRADVSATFNVPVDFASITPATFFVTGPGGVPVSGTYSISVDKRFCSFKPQAPFTPGAVYTATTTIGIRSAGGLSLAYPNTWTFTDAQGNAVVVYKSTPDQYNPYYLFGERYVKGSGWAGPDAVALNSSATDARVSMDDHGNAFVVWLETSGTTKFVYSRRYTSGQ